MSMNPPTMPVLQDENKWDTDQLAPLERTPSFFPVLPPLCRRVSVYHSGDHALSVPRRQP